MCVREREREREGSDLPKIDFSEAQHHGHVGAVVAHCIHRLKQHVCKLYKCIHTDTNRSGIGDPFDSIYRVRLIGREAKDHNVNPLQEYGTRTPCNSREQRNRQGQQLVHVCKHI